MADLVTKYGREWFNNKFPGSYFMYKGIPARVGRAERSPTSRDGSVVHITMCPRVNNEVKVVKSHIPTDYFQNSDMFSVPELGYRHTANGKWLAFLQRNNSSYVRGLSTRNLNVFESEFTKFLKRNGVREPTPNEDVITSLVMEPTFVPLHRGIKMMLEGKLLAFAASPTVAVVPAKAHEGLQILMCDKEIGSVDVDGAMNITLPTARNYVEETLCDRQ